MIEDLFLIEDHLWLNTVKIGVPIYDFDFRQFFDCRVPFDLSDQPLPGVTRIGAFEDYEALFQKLASNGISLVHSPTDHFKCTSLPIWYPLIKDITPRSHWFSEIPSFKEIEQHFELPIFIKGARQTSKHKAEASIIRSETDFDIATDIYRKDPVLHWQEFVCRELLDLRPVSGGIADKVPASFEFRTFWWRGELVGEGRYWFEAQPYGWNDSEKNEALKIAKQAVDALNCTFPVIDLAQTKDGEWIVIECNDGMESGYAGCSPFSLWRNILDIEKAN